MMPKQRHNPQPPPMTVSNWPGAETTAIPRPKKSNLRRRWIFTILAGVGILLLAFGVSNVQPTASGHEDLVISACQDSVKNQLKDPDSAEFSGWKAQTVSSSTKQLAGYHPENGDVLYSASGSVNAKNGFGGYNGSELWACDAYVTNSSPSHARAIARDGAG